jgi:hypothetical protein
MQQKLIKSFLRSSNFTAVNNDLVKAIGLHNAFVLGKILSYEDYYEKIGKLDNDGYFQLSQLKLEEELKLSKFLVKNILDELEKLGLLQKKRMGMPIKTFFKIPIAFQECVENLLLPQKPLDLNSQNSSLSIVNPVVVSGSENLTLNNSKKIIKNIKEIYKEKGTDDEVVVISDFEKEPWTNDRVTSYPVFDSIVDTKLELPFCEKLKKVDNIKSLIADKVVLIMNSNTDYNDKQLITILMGVSLYKELAIEQELQVKNYNINKAKNKYKLQNFTDLGAGVINMYTEIETERNYLREEMEKNKLT